MGWGGESGGGGAQGVKLRAASLAQQHLACWSDWEFLTVIRNELLILMTQDKHVVFQSDEVQVLVKHLRNERRRLDAPSRYFVLSLQLPTQQIHTEDITYMSMIYVMM